MAQSPDRGLVTTVGPISIDVPRTAGYFGGIALAVGVGIIDWPIAVFLGAIPLVKMAQRSNLPAGVRFMAQVYEGASKPVGGDAEGTIHLPEAAPRRRRANVGWPRSAPPEPTRARSTTGRAIV